MTMGEMRKHDHGGRGIVFNYGTKFYDDGCVIEYVLCTDCGEYINGPDPDKEHAAHLN